MRSGNEDSKRYEAGMVGMSTTIRRILRSLQKRLMRSSRPTARSISCGEWRAELPTALSNLACSVSRALKNAQTPLKASE